MSRDLTIAVILAALAAGLAGYSYAAGVDAERARNDEARRATQQELFDLGEELSRKAAELEAAKAERQDLVQSLEAEAANAPGADRPGVGADGLQRLERRWSTP